MSELTVREGRGFKIFSSLSECEGLKVCKRGQEFLDRF